MIDLSIVIDYYRLTTPGKEQLAPVIPLTPITGSCLNDVSDSSNRKGCERRECRKNLNSRQSTWIRVTLTWNQALFSFCFTKTSVGKRAKFQRGHLLPLIFASSWETSASREPQRERESLKISPPSRLTLASLGSEAREKNFSSPHSSDRLLRLLLVTPPLFFLELAQVCLFT